MIKHIFNCILVFFAEIRLFIDIKPHLSKMTEGFFATDIHAGLHQYLSL